MTYILLEPLLSIAVKIDDDGIFPIIFFETLES